MKRWLALGLVVFGLSACSVPPLDFTPPSVDLAQNRINAQLQALTVSIADTDDRTGEIEAAGAEADVIELWESALEDSIARSNLFMDGSMNNVSLIVTIRELDCPPIGIDFTCEAGARYEMINRATGATVYVSEILTTGLSPASDAFFAIVRAREAGSRAVQNNIVEFLADIQSARIRLPSTPGSVPST